MNNKRELIFFRHYFHEFFDSLSEKVKEKIDYVLFLVRVADRIPKKFFQYIEGTDGLFEIRIEFESNIYRVFCFFDEGYLVVLLNGFQKKTNKTPKNEIEKALKIKKEYFEFKKHNNGNK